MSSSGARPPSPARRSPRGRCRRRRSGPAGPRPAAGRSGPRRRRRGGAGPGPRSRTGTGPSSRSRGPRALARRTPPDQPALDHVGGTGPVALGVRDDRESISITVAPAGLQPRAGDPPAVQHGAPGLDRPGASASSPMYIRGTPRRSPARSRCRRAPDRRRAGAPRRAGSAPTAASARNRRRSSVRRDDDVEHLQQVGDPPGVRHDDVHRGHERPVAPDGDDAARGRVGDEAVVRGGRAARRPRLLPSPNAAKLAAVAVPEPFDDPDANAAVRNRRCRGSRRGRRGRAACRRSPWEACS